MRIDMGDYVLDGYYILKLSDFRDFVDPETLEYLRYPNRIELIVKRFEKDGKVEEGKKLVLTGEEARKFWKLRKAIIKAIFR